jgi:hypothetical protein
MSTYVDEDSAFFLPDSLPYRRAGVADGVISCTVGLQYQSGESNYVFHAQADWGDDPRAADLCWVQLHLTMEGRQPLGVSYRVVALCDPAAVADA